MLADRSQPFVDDESNQDVSIPRNRVRAELLPLLEERFNPGIVDVLADQAEARARHVGLDGRDRVGPRSAERPPWREPRGRRRVRRSTSTLSPMPRSRSGAPFSGG